MHVVSVEPLGAGWIVRWDQVDNQMVFRSGRDAEDAAKGLAERLAASGRTVEIRVFVRGGVLAGRFICPAKPSPAPIDEEAGSLALAGSKICTPDRRELKAVG